MADNEEMTHRMQPEPVHTILIVEDSDNCAAAMEIAVLGIPGVSVLRAFSGMEALRILEQSGSEVQAIITDLNMPRMDGFELIQRLRQDERRSGVPIIVVSADTDPGTPGRMTEMKVDAFFAKPFSPAAVRRKLEQLLDVTANATTDRTAD